MMKSRNMIWAGHVVSMGDERNAYRVLGGNLVGRGDMELL
jgi:hypothetical protein